MPLTAFDRNWAFPLAFALFGGMALLLRRNLGPLLFYLVGTLGLVVFLYIKYLGFYRHTGFLFLTLLFAFWLKKKDRVPPGGGWSVWTDRTAEVVFAVMLAMQAITGLWAVREDFNQPFSCGRLAAKYLVDHNLQRAFLAVGPDWAGSPLAGYLDRSIYFPTALRYGSFTRWDDRRTDYLSEEEFFRRASEEAKGVEMVLSIDPPFSEEFMRRHDIKLLVGLHGSLTQFEDYRLYFVPGKAASGQ
jgi:hypothetical protein